MKGAYQQRHPKGGQHARRKTIHRKEHKPQHHMQQRQRVRSNTSGATHAAQRHRREPKRTLGKGWSHQKALHNNLCPPRLHHRRCRTQQIEAPTELMMAMTRMPNKGIAKNVTTMPAKHAVNMR